MANKPRITLGLPDHPRCRAMIDGKVGVEGYELDIDPNFVSSGERHYKFLHGQWDVGECSAASLLRAIEKGQPLLAIPVFFERGPRQRNIYHCEGKLKQPAELKGKNSAASATERRPSSGRAAIYSTPMTSRPLTCSGSFPARGFHRPRASRESRAHRSAAAFRPGEKLQLSKCSAKAPCMAPSCRVTRAIWDYSAAARPRP